MRTHTAIIVSPSQDSFYNGFPGFSQAEEDPFGLSFPHPDQPETNTDAAAPLLNSTPFSQPPGTFHGISSRVKSSKLILSPVVEDDAIESEPTDLVTEYNIEPAPGTKPHRYTLKHARLMESAFGAISELDSESCSTEDLLPPGPGPDAEKEMGVIRGEEGGGEGGKDGVEWGGREGRGEGGWGGQEGTEVGGEEGWGVGGMEDGGGGEGRGEGGWGGGEGGWGGEGRGVGGGEGGWGGGEGGWGGGEGGWGGEGRGVGGGEGGWGGGEGGWGGGGEGGSEGGDGEGEKGRRGRGKEGAGDSKIARRQLMQASVSKGMQDIMAKVVREKKQNSPKVNKPHIRSHTSTSSSPNIQEKPTAVSRMQVRTLICSPVTSTTNLKKYPNFVFTPASLSHTGRKSVPDQEDRSASETSFGEGVLSKELEFSDSFEDSGDSMRTGSITTSRSASSSRRLDDDASRGNSEDLKAPSLEHTIQEHTTEQSLDPDMMRNGLVDCGSTTMDERNSVNSFPSIEERMDKESFLKGKELRKENGHDHFSDSNKPLDTQSHSRSDPVHCSSVDNITPFDAEFKMAACKPEEMPQVDTNTDTDADLNNNTPGSRPDKAPAIHITIHANNLPVLSTDTGLVRTDDPEILITPVTPVTPSTPSTPGTPFIPQHMHSTPSLYPQYSEHSGTTEEPCTVLQKRPSSASNYSTEMELVQPLSAILYRKISDSATVRSPLKASVSTNDIRTERVTQNHTHYSPGRMRRSTTDVAVERTSVTKLKRPHSFHISKHQPKNTASSTPGVDFSKDEFIRKAALKGLTRKPRAKRGSQEQPTSPSRVATVGKEVVADLDALVQLRHVYGAEPGSRDPCFGTPDAGNGHAGNANQTSQHTVKRRHKFGEMSTRFSLNLEPNHHQVHSHTRTSSARTRGEVNTTPTSEVIVRAEGPEKRGSPRPRSAPVDKHNQSFTGLSIFELDNMKMTEF